jgi:hypothetical protein
MLCRLTVSLIGENGKRTFQVEHPIVEGVSFPIDIRLKGPFTARRRSILKGRLGARAVIFAEEISCVIGLIGALEIISERDFIVRGEPYLKADMWRPVESAIGKALMEAYGFSEVEVSSTRPADIVSA